jgi:carbon-monoxide dehydrogenase small subunit
LKQISVQVNGAWRQGWAHPGQTLLAFLRGDLESMEVKQGCGRGDCGSCSVILDGVLVNSCLVLALQADGCSIITAAGLGTRESPSPVQQAFLEVGAIQCGFCTPGMVLAAKALLDEQPRPDVEQIKRGLSGNLCRCTGYKKIIEAVQLASGRLADAATEGKKG